MTTWVYFIAEYDSVYSGWEEAINELGSLSFKVVQISRMGSVSWIWSEDSIFASK